MKSKKERKDEILKVLSEPIKERDLHRRLRIDNSFCSKLLKELSQEGMIEIEEVRDRLTYGKCKKVTITKKGRQEIGLKEMDIKGKVNKQKFSEIDYNSIEREIQREGCGEW
jgi:DNA-binding MarR family transcriptional regulator